MPDPEPIGPIDPMLRLLVSITNELFTGVGISVLVGGSWVSGTLISPRVFTTEVADLLERDGGEGGAAFRKLFDGVGANWFPAESEREAKGEDAPGDRELPVHMHLRGGRVIIDGDVQVPSAGGHIRIRLDRVGGWMVGQLGAILGATPPPPLER